MIFLTTIVLHKRLRADGRGFTFPSLNLLSIKRKLGVQTEALTVMHLMRPVNNTDRRYFPVPAWPFIFALRSRNPWRFVWKVKSFGVYV